MPILSENSVGKKCTLRLPVVERLNQKYLPVFLTRSHLVSSYEKLQVSPQEIRGETLLAMLPYNLGLVFEPNSSLEVKFSRHDLGLDHNSSPKNRSEVREVNVNRAVKSDADVPETHKGVQTIQSKGIALVDLKKLEAELTMELGAHEEVLEAFFIPHTSSYSDAILGILREELDEEKRYDLSESIARISNNFYGYAGAIEIFDDLLNPDSKAWSQFKSEAPFYRRDNITDQIEISTTSSVESKREGLLSSFGNFKKTGLKLFHN